MKKGVCLSVLASKQKNLQGKGRGIMIDREGLLIPGDGVSDGEDGR